MGCKWAVKWLFLEIICGCLGARIGLSLFGGLCCALWLPGMNGPRGRSHIPTQMLANSWHTRALCVEKARIFLSYFAFQLCWLWWQPTVNDSFPFLSSRCLCCQRNLLLPILELIRKIQLHRLHVIKRVRLALKFNCSHCFEFIWFTPQFPKELFGRLELSKVPFGAWPNGS